MSHIFRDLVTAGALSFNDGVLLNGAVYRCDLLDGWDDTAEPRVEISEYGYSDGVRASDRFPKKEIYLDIGGYVKVTSRLAGEQAKDYLASNLDVNSVIRVTRQGPIPKAVDVRVCSAVEFPQDIGEAFRWLVKVMATWPYKISPIAKSVIAAMFSGIDYYRTYVNTAPYYRTYVNTAPYYRTYTADTSAYSTGGLPNLVAISNDGNADAYPIIQLSGPLMGRSWELVNETTGESLTFGLDLSSTDTLVLNTLDKTAYLGSQSVEYYVDGDWPHLQPGANILRVLIGTDNADARITVTAYDTWKR